MELVVVVHLHQKHSVWAAWIWDVSVPGKICIAFSSWNEHTFILLWTNLDLLNECHLWKKHTRKQTCFLKAKQRGKNIWIETKVCRHPMGQWGCASHQRHLWIMCYTVSVVEVPYEPPPSFLLCLIPPVLHPSTLKTHPAAHSSCFIQQPMGRLCLSLKSAAKIM